MILHVMSNMPPLKKFLSAILHLTTSNELGLRSFLKTNKKDDVLSL